LIRFLDLLGNAKVEGGTLMVGWKYVN